MAEQLHLAVDQGVRVVLVAPMVAGLPAFAELTADHRDVAFLAHPAFAGTQRIALAVLLGRLFRLAGADAVIFSNHGGRFGYSPRDCVDLVRAARAPCELLRPILPVPAGGMSVDRRATTPTTAEAQVRSSATAQVRSSASRPAGQPGPGLCRRHVHRIQQPPRPIPE